MSFDETIFRDIKDLTPEDKGRSPVLIVIFGEGTGRVYKVSHNMPMVIGRTKEADIVINDAGISRKHAKTSVLGSNKVFITDLNSTNGTFVNGQRITEHQLADGDKIQVGNAAILKFSYQDDLEESFQKNLYESATKDPLVGIYNKRFFLDTFSQEFSYSKRADIQFSLIMFDIDHFKKINDTYGHQAGDYVLKKIGEIIPRQLRNEDIFCRYGGEEFAIIVKGKAGQQALIFANRLLELVAKTLFEFEDKKIDVTISMGISTMDSDKFEQSDEMIKEADEYLYKAKHNGRNRVESELTEC